MFWRYILPSCFILGVSILSGGFWSAPVAQAIIVDDIAEQAIRHVVTSVEGYFHVNEETAQQYGEAFNVSTQKNLAPQVTLVFTPNDPKPGQEVSANAFPVYFSNPAEKLYYTWYLKRRHCDKDPDITRETNEEKLKLKKACDLDNDNDIDENDWKIEAMRIYAQNKYVEELSDKNAPDDKDTDGYVATPGGGGQVDEKQCGPEDDPWYCCYVHDFEGGTDYELTNCVNPVHLFPEFPTSQSSCTEDKDKPVKTGDGKFPHCEENLWGTNYTDPDTAQNSNKDEANVVGFGAKNFTWVYNTKDMVGVVVEGRGMNATKHDNSSRMIEWAFVKNDCSPINDSVSSYTKEIKGYDVVIPTTTMDLNDCLEDNLIDPIEGGQPGNMSLTMDYDPIDPVAQIIDDTVKNPRGDVLTVRMISNNSANDASTIWYGWNIKISTDGTFNPRFDNPAQWDDITDILVKKELITSVEGNGIDRVKMDLNLGDYPADDPDIPGGYKFSEKFRDGVGYLYFVGTAKEDYQQGVGRGARTAQVIKVTLSNFDIHVHKILTGETSDGLTRVYLDPDKEICTDDLSLKNCKLVKNEVIALKAPDLSGSTIKYDQYFWTINGKPLLCNTSVSPKNEKISPYYCEDARQTEINFFPALGNVGERYVISLTMTSSDTGENLNLTRAFFIVDPGVSIEPNNEDVWKKFLGAYRDVDNGTMNDFSKNIFETYPENLVSLKAVYTADSMIGSDVQLAWLLDGIIVTPDDGDFGKVLTFNASEKVGDTQSVVVRGIYKQPQDIRKALKDIWSVSPFESAEGYFETQVQVEVVEPETDEVAAAGLFKTPMKYFASLVAYVPETVLFILRLAFMFSLAMFSIGILWSFLPQSYDNRS